MSGNTSDSTNNDMPLEPVGFRIAVFSVPDDLESLEKVLMDLPNMDRATARLQTRLLPGIVQGTYAQDVAVSTVKEIEHIAGTASVVPSNSVPDLNHVHATHHVNLTDIALETIDPSDRLQSWAWNTVSVISVGVLPSSAPSRSRSAPTLSSGSSHRSWNSGVKIAAKPRPEAYVVLSDGQATLNMASDEMNFEYLGDRLAKNSSANFMLLIRDLVRRATNASITPATIAFLEHTHLPRSDFRSHEEFRRYTEFQTLLSRRQKEMSEQESIRDQVSLM